MILSVEILPVDFNVETLPNVDWVVTPAKTPIAHGNYYITGITKCDDLQTFVIAAPGKTISMFFNTVICKLDTLYSLNLMLK